MPVQWTFEIKTKSFFWRKILDYIFFHFFGEPHFLFSSVNDYDYRSLLRLFLTGCFELANDLLYRRCPKRPTLLPRKFLLSCPNVPTFGTFGASKLVGPKLLTKIAFYHNLIFSLDKTHFPSMQTRLTHKTRLFLADCFALSGVFIEDKNKSIFISRF